MLNKRQNWAGSLHLLVIWVLRNHAIASSRFAVRLRSCWLKADHGLLKDFKDKITSAHTKKCGLP